MSELGDAFKILKQRGQRKRASNREKSTKILEEAEINFTVQNNGAHLIITYLDKIVDFWPGTGLWIVRHGHRGRGVYNLLKHLGV